jgi:16S rRNA processing protein RimM
VFSYTQPREAIIGYDRWLLKKSGSWQATSVAAGKRHGKLVVAQLEGVEDRDQAAELVGCDIAIARNDLPKAEGGSYYWADLEGLQVVHRDGTEIGRVAYLMETGANDVLVTEGKRERLIPFIAEKVILDVDFVKGVISVDWEWD